MLEDFAEILAKKYRFYCQREGQQMTLPGFVLYLSRCQVIRDRTAAKYMVMEKYPEALYNEDSKTGACRHLSVITGLSEQTIWNMVQHPERYSPMREV